ncbi:MAG: heavy metal translocating P-type ATPase [Arenicella sp.]|nr:heavy metal translocating P-type ATPase [Arenicella sp.]
MSDFSVATAGANSGSNSATCYHCLEPIPKFCSITTDINGVSQPMCCLGCKAAADFIQQRSLTRFYEHRDRVNQRDFFGSLNAQELTVLNTQEWLFLDDLSDPRRVECVQVDSKGTRRLSLLVHGLYCSSCAWLIERALHSISQDIRVHVEIDALRVNLQVLNPDVELAELVLTISRLGYRPELVPANAWFDLEQSHTQERSSALRRLMVAGFCMMQVMTYAAGSYLADASSQAMLPEYERFFLLVSLLVATLAVFYSGMPFFKNAYNDLKNRHVGMDVPVALAIGGAYLPSVYEVLSHSVGDAVGAVYFDSAVMFVFFLSIGRYVEMRARHHLADSSGEINRMLPDKITVQRVNGDQVEEHRIAPKLIELSDRITLNVGDVVPFDARLIRGEASFDESLMTGESLAVQHGVGEQVYVGARLLRGEVTISANKVWIESSLFKINQLVQNASADTAPTKLSQVGRNFVLWVIVLTVLVGAVWFYIAPDRVFHIVLAMLVASCPCAFSLAAPVGRTAAAHTLRRSGILLSNPEALSVASKVSHWLFDKTGTLTMGKPSVEDVVVLSEMSEQKCLTMVADVEHYSDHSLANAFAGFASELGDAKLVEKFVDEPGCGVRALYAGKPVFIGKRSWVLEQLANTVPSQYADESFAQVSNLSNNHYGASEIAVAYAGILVAVIHVTDSVRTSSSSALRQLSATGASVKVISGDKASAVAAVCDELSVRDYQADMLLADKLTVLRRLQMDGGVVAMVGDGVNDAPVLAGADLSIALATGSELSQYHADVVLLNGDLSQLTSLSKVAQTTEKVTRQNLNWALFYNGLALPFAALGFLTPWLAALGMSLSSLLVVLNALRIKRQASDSLANRKRARLLTQNEI